MLQGKRLRPRLALLQATRQQGNSDMTDKEELADTILRSTCAMIEAMGAHAENMQRAAVGSSMAYDENCFIQIIEKYKLLKNRP